MSQAPECILVVGPSWVGDMVMAQSLFMTLKQQRSGADIDVLAPSWSLPLLARMSEVRHAFELPIKHGELGLRVRVRMSRSVNKCGYSQAIVLPGSLKAALIPFLARIRRRTGYRGEMRYGLINDMRPRDKSRCLRTVDSYVALGLEPWQAALAFPPPRLRADSHNGERVRATLGLALDPPIIGLMPGAEYGPAKQWPLDYYGTLAQALMRAGKQLWIFGSGNDFQAGESIRERAGAGPIHNLCGKTRLEDAIDLIALTAGVVTNDSGLMHIAAALQRPLVAIFGSSNPTVTPPLAQAAEVLYLGLSCSPCFERVCPLGHLRCLRELTPELVMSALARLGCVDYRGSHNW